MFFVDDHESECMARCKERRARADHEHRFTAPNALPFKSACGWRETTMQYRDARTVEHLFKSVNGEFREENFRHQHNRLSSFRRGIRNQRCIHFRLSAPGDTEEERWPRIILNRCISRLLYLREFRESHGENPVC